MSVRAKFRVESITERKHWDRAKPNIKDVKLIPVMDDSPENKTFYAATPSGEIVLGCANAAAAAQFIVGQEFYVDFTPIVRVPSGDPSVNVVRNSA